MLIQGKILFGNADLSEAFHIRRNVFVNELHIPEEKEFDELDSSSMHVIVYEELDQKKAVATGRIYYDGTTCEISCIAVLKEYRRKKYGDFAIRMLLNKAFISGINEVICKVPKASEEFFTSIGFHSNDVKSNKEDLKCIEMVITEKDIITNCKKTKKN